MTAIDQHTLNQLLAKWAGVEVVEVASSLDPDSLPQWIYDTGKRVLKHEKLSQWATWDVWDPFTDANHMELAKAGLREKGYGYEITWFASKRIHRALVWKLQIWEEGWNKSEALALALAIQALEE